MSEKKLISVMIIAFSLALFCSYHIYYYFVDINSNKLVNKYYEKENIKESKPIVAKKMNVEEKSDNKEEYLGILSIPKIKLKTGFYNKDNSKNNVSKSVTLLKESIMPGKSNSIVYLAAHSGIGHLAYFKDLNKLTDGDLITLSINKTDYLYTISDIYEMPKNGEIIVNRNVNENYLVLTTCSKNKNMQLVVISKLIK